MAFQPGAFFLLFSATPPRFRVQGAGGTDGQGIGGGLYIAPSGAVTLKHTRVVFNFASTSDNNIYGTVTYA